MSIGHHSKIPLQYCKFLRRNIFLWSLQDLVNFQVCAWLFEAKTFEGTQTTLCSNNRGGSWTETWHQRGQRSRISNQQLVCSGKVWGKAIKSFTTIETKDRWWYCSLMNYMEILLPNIPVYRSALKVVQSENSKTWITFRCRFLFWPTFAWPAALHGEVSRARTKPEEFPEKMPKTKTKSNEEKNVTRAVNYCTKRRLSNQIRLFATIWFVGSCVSTSDWIS